MNIEYYRNFVAIIDQGSMAAASEVLHIAQPALSNQLKTLEKTYGVELMTRSGRKLIPTEAGLILYNKAKAICAEEDAVQSQIQACITGTQGILRLGITFLLPDKFLTQLLADFSNEYPKIRYDIQEHKTSTLIQLLTNNDVDVIMVSNSHPLPASVRISRAISTTAMVAFPRDNPWFSPEMTSIPIEMLKGVPIAYTRGTEKRFLSACEKAGFTPNTFAVCSTRGSALIWSQTKKAASVFISMTPDLYETDTVCCRPLSGHDLQSQRVFAVLSDRALPPVVQTFLDFATKRISDYYNEHPSLSD